MFHVGSFREMSGWGFRSVGCGGAWNPSRVGYDVASMPRIGKVSLGLVLLALAGPAVAAAPADGYAGRPLAEVLREIQDEGLPIVFTSELIGPDLVVEEEPSAGAADDPRRLLDELLAHHGLAVREGPGGVLVVVRSDAGSGEPPPGREAAGAADPVERIYVRDEIVVRPSRLSVLFERPDSPIALSREEIDGLPHLGGDLFRALSLFPGVTGNDVSAAFSVHGGRSDEVRVVLDGMELYDAFHLRDYDSALSIVPARSLGGAQLLTGAFPVSHGDRMSGVLELESREPEPGRHLALGIDVLDALAQGAGLFADGRGAWMVTGRRGSLDLAGDAIGDEHPAFWDVLGKAEIDTQAGRFGLHALVADDELELLAEAEDEFERLENDYHRSYIWLRHRKAFRDRLLVETLASRSRIERDRASETREEEGSFGLRDRRDLEVLGLTQSWDLQLDPRHLVRWGWELRRYDAAFDYDKTLDREFVVVAPFSPPTPPVHRFAGTVEGDHAALWVSDRLSLFERLTVELGIRYDRHPGTDDTLASPRINLAWRLGERSVARAAWGRFYQSQRPYELQVEDAETGLYPAELSEHWVLGYEAFPAENRLGLDALRVELFRRDVPNPRPRYENLLEPLNFFPEIEPDRVRIDPTHSTSQGVELLVRGRAGTRVGWWAAYSWSRVEDRLDGRTVPRSLDQPHTATVAVDLALPRRWNLALAWRYHSGWPTTPVSAGFVAPEEDDEEEPELVARFGELNSERLPVYHRLDLRASRTRALRKGSLTFYVDVQNLYDRENLAGFDLAVDEEPIEDGVTAELEPEHWPGLFPSVGVLWEW
jgi:outer membrane receptor protein involved in Fe transport